MAFSERAPKVPSPGWERARMRGVKDISLFFSLSLQFVGNHVSV
jgi:hypothetical protein